MSFLDICLKKKKYTLEATSALFFPKWSLSGNRTETVKKTNSNELSKKGLNVNSVSQKGTGDGDGELAAGEVEQQKQE